MRRLPLSQWALRAGCCTAPVLAVLASVPVGATVPPRLLVGLVLVALLGAAYPESPAAILAPLVVIGWWATRVDDQTHPLVLVAAGCLLIGHTCAVVAGLGPPSYDVERATLLLWARRVAMLFPVSMLAWLVTRAGEGQSYLRVWAIAAVVAVGLLVIATSALADRQDET
jgi:hypothetical protein